MVRHLLTFFCFLAFPPCAQSSELDLLARKLQRLKSLWPEGSMECKVVSPFGSTNVRATWAGETVRLDYSALRRGDKESKVEVGAGPKRDLIILRNRRRQLSFDAETDVAVIQRIDRATPVSPSLRLLPSECWSEILANQSLAHWLGLYRSDGETKIVCDEIEAGGWRLELASPTGSVFEARFGGSGELLRAKTVEGPSNQGRLDIQVEWDQARTPPHPIRLKKTVAAAGAKPQLMLSIEVIDFSPRLGEIGGQLSFPPKDLPIGTRISDSETGRVSYVGGEIGEQQFSIRAKARRLKDANKIE